MKRLRRSLEAVVFDLDGLAVDSEPVHLEAWRRAGRPTEAKPTRRQTPSEVAENIRKAEGDEAVAE